MVRCQPTTLSGHPGHREMFNGGGSGAGGGGTRLVRMVQ